MKWNLQKGWATVSPRTSGLVGIAMLTCLMNTIPAVVAHAALDIQVDYETYVLDPASGTFLGNVAEAPTWDGDGAKLRSLVEEAAARWEAAFPSVSETVRIHYYWDKRVGGSTLGWERPKWLGSGYRIAFFHQGQNWWVDTTPTDDREFNFVSGVDGGTNDGITLYRDLNTKNKTGGTAAWFTGSPPPDLEVRCRGLQRYPLYGESSDLYARADSAWDLMSVAMHEIGHALLDPGYDPARTIWPISTGFSFGAFAIVAASSTSPNDHLMADCLMDPGAPAKYRYLPSAMEILAVATARGWTSFSLPRAEFWSAFASVPWNTASVWTGGAPGPATDCFLREDGKHQVYLTAATTVGTLYVGHNTFPTADSLLLRTNGRGLVASDSVMIENSITTMLLAGLTELRIDGGGLSSTWGISIFGGKLNIGSGSTVQSLNTGITVNGYGQLYAGLGAHIYTMRTVGVGKGAITLGGATVTADRLEISQMSGLVEGTGSVSGLSRLRNDGTIRSSNGPLTFSEAAAGGASAFDLDGLGEYSSLIEAGGGSITFQGTQTDGFDGTMKIGGSYSIVETWGLLLSPSARVLFIGPLAKVVSPTITATTAATISTSSTDCELQASSMITLDHASVTVTAPGSLSFSGPTTFRGGNYSGTGKLVQRGNATVALPTDITSSGYIWDGEVAGGVSFTSTTVNPGVTFHITGGISATPLTDGYDGTVTVKSGAVLQVDNAWILQGAIVLEGGTIRGGKITNQGSITGYGTIESAMDNQGTITGSGGTLALTGIYTGTGTLSGKVTRTSAFMAVAPMDRPALVSAASPNPCRDSAMLSIQVSEASVASVALFDISGRLVLESRFDLMPGSNRLPLEVGQLTSGTYFLRASGTGFTSRQKLLVLK